MEIEEKYLQGVETLVPFPQIALEVLDIAYSKECNFKELSKKIEQDQNLVANMLRMANSAYFGHMKKITSILDIIVRLGLENVKMIAISSASLGVLKTPQEAYHIEPGDLWRHTFATATLAAIIGKYARYQEGTALYTAGLLHDVGKVVLNGPLLSAIFNNPDLGQNNMDIIDYERAFLQTDHAKVGMLLLQQWNLPDQITIPVGFHHSSDQAETNRHETKIVALANILARSIEFHATEKDAYILQVKEYISSNAKLPRVEHFHDNIEDIFSQFYEKMNDPGRLFF